MLVRRVGRRRTVLIAAALAAAALAGSDARADDGNARSLSLNPIPEDGTWRDQILDSPTPTVGPTKTWAAGDTASVRDPEALVTQTDATAACISGAGQLIVDLGRTAGGIIHVDIASADAQTNLVLGYSETQRYMTPQGDYTPVAYNAGRTDIVRTDTVRTTGGKQSWSSPAIRGSQRYIVLTVAPSLAALPAGEVCVDSLSVEIRHLRPEPDDYVGHFFSNDPVLNRAWYSGAHTFHLATVPGCCGQMVVTDGAKRDRQMWAGDLAAAGATGAVSTKAGLQAWKDTLAAFSCYTYPGGYVAAAAPPTSTCQGKQLPLGQPGPDYPVYAAFPVIGAYEALYVSSNYDYWRRSGDDAFARSQLPILQGAMRWMGLHLQNGLYNPTPNEWQWTAGFADGADTYTNGVWVSALRQLATMERTFGEPGAAQEHEAQADAIAAAVNQQLWDETSGAYRASTTRSAPGQDGNVAAVIAGVATHEQAERALQYLAAKLRTPFGTRASANSFISPFISGFELRARLLAGDVDGALELIRMTWKPMIEGDPGGTTWERLHATEARPNTGQESTAHPWGSQPTSVLTDYVLGIRAAAPGYVAWTVSPQPGDLDWAQGTLPTPRGPIASRWRRGSDSFQVTVVAPIGTVGTVVVPTFGRDLQIWRDGKLVWNGTGPGHDVPAQAVPGGVAFTETGGSHTYAWTD